MAWAGAPAAFVLATMLSAAAVALLLRLHEPPRAPAAPRHPLLELRDGAQLVWQHALLRPILLTAVAWNTAWFVLQAAYVPYAMRALGLDAAGVGLTLAAYGSGMVAGALLAPRIVARLSFGHAILLGPLMSVAAMATMVASLAWPHGTLAGTSFFLFGFGPIVWTITSTTLRQTVTPGAMLGRVSAMFLTVNMGARPLGAALGGVVGEHWGEAACLWLALAGFVVQAAVIMLSRLRGCCGCRSPSAEGGLGDARLGSVDMPDRCRRRLVAGSIDVNSAVRLLVEQIQLVSGVGQIGLGRHRAARRMKPRFSRRPRPTRSVDMCRARHRVEAPS